MKELAVYCAKSWRISCFLTTGVWEMQISPPLTASSVNLADLHAKVVYIRLHGIDGQPNLYSDPGWYTSLTTEQVEQADFSGSVVFLEGCNGDEIQDAFLKAGAVAVAGNSDSTWGRKYRKGPSSKVGAAFLHYYRNKRLTPKQALKRAIIHAPPKYRSGWSIKGKKKLEELKT